MSHANALFPILLLSGSLMAGERINHEGRILGIQPAVTTPTLFNTTQSDAVVSTMQIFPRDNAWNEDVSTRPLLSNSAAMISQMRTDLGTLTTLRPFYEMNFVLVPDSQANIPITFFNYADESDPSPYPIPNNMPVEGYVRETAALTNFQWQQDINTKGGDRHSIIVMPGSGFVWETWLTKRSGGTALPEPQGGTGGTWQASNGAKFNLNSNALRPATWTSADASGSTMFGGLVRYDECQRGEVEHAIRCIVKRSRKSYIYPAVHAAGSTTLANVPAMGERLRLKAGFAVPAGWTTAEKAICYALKKYGCIVTDNGGFFSISVAPDQRFASNAFSNITTLDLNNFDVIQTTAATGGPRSAGAPTCNAGSDRNAAVGTPISLTGSASGQALTYTWYQYNKVGYTPPGTANFSAPNALTTSVTFSATGTYTIVLKAADGTHTPAFDALIVTVSTNQTPVIPSAPSALPNPIKQK